MSKNVDFSLLGKQFNFPKLHFFQILEHGGAKGFWANFLCVKKSHGRNTYFHFPYWQTAPVNGSSLTYQNTYNIKDIH